MELTKERLIMAIVGAMLLIPFILYIFVYSPLINELKAAHSECRTMEERVFKTREAIALLEKMALKKNLIDEMDISFAIDELTRLGKSKGINFISITPRNIEMGKGQYRIMPIEIEIESSYRDLGVFLGSLDTLKRCLVTAKSLNIMPDIRDNTKLKSRLILNMHLKEEEKEANT